MRVVHVLTEIGRHGGGPAVAVTNLSIALINCGIDSQIVGTTTLSESTSSEAFPEGLECVPHRAFRVQRFDPLAINPVLAAYLYSVGRDDLTVFHIHGLFQFPQAATYATSRFANTPYIVSPRGMLDPALRSRGKVRKRLTDILWQQRMLNNAGLIHYTSAGEAELAQDVIQNRSIAVIPNGLRTWGPDSPGRTEAIRNELGLHSGPIIVNHGRIDQKKGLDILIRAMSIVVPEHPDLQLVLAGPDSRGHIQELRELATVLGLQRHVVFAGQRDRTDLHSLLSLADVWALPTLSENFGNSLVEAMAMGVPCITTASVNIAPEAAAHGAVLISKRSAESFADAIRSLLIDQTLAESTSRMASAYVNRFDWSSVAATFAKAYKRVLDGRNDGES